MVVILGGIINLFTAEGPADAKSTAEPKIVAPTPIAENTAVALLAFISTPTVSSSNISLLCIAICPLAETTILDAGVLFILTAAPKAVVPIPIAAVSTAVVNVATPATLKLFKVDIPTVVLVLPARVPDTLPVNEP